MRLHGTTRRALLVTCYLLPALCSLLPAQSLQGVWETEGYGYSVVFKGDSLFFSEVTSVSCIPTMRAARVEPPAGAPAAYRLAGAPLTFLVLPAGGKDRARLHMNGAASDMVIRRRAAAPEVCSHPTPDTPPMNFEVFARTWAEQYGFFGVRDVDWHQIVVDHRPLISDSTSAATLLAVLTEMIEPFHDAHTGIYAGQVGRFQGARRTENFLERADLPKAYALTETYFKEPLHKFCNGQLEFGMAADGVGYLRLRSFSRYGPEGSFESGLTALEAALDTIFTTASAWHGMIIDVRINGGGADPYGLAIAARLATAPYVAYSKQARADAADPTKWTPAQDSRVVPSSRPGFHGPVVELTGIHSVSAAETFTQALLHRTPHVTRMGENTQGVFSDVLGRKLPNGWQFGLPNERFVTDGKAYDGPGIPPDVVVPVFAKVDMTAGKDVALEQALAHLKN